MILEQKMAGSKCSSARTTHVAQCFPTSVTRMILTIYPTSWSWIPDSDRFWHTNWSILPPRYASQRFQNATQFQTRSTRKYWTVCSIFRMILALLTFLSQWTIGPACFPSHTYRQAGTEPSAYSRNAELWEAGGLGNGTRSVESTFEFGCCRKRKWQWWNGKCDQGNSKESWGEYGCEGQEHSWAGKGREAEAEAPAEGRRQGLRGWGRRA